MTYTATATRGVPPTSINLNVFSHPPVNRELLEITTLEPHLMPVITLLNPETPSTQLSDSEEIFDLDMVTMDMDFVHTSMHAHLQKKNALLEVEQLEKAQQLNRINRHTTPGNILRGHSGVDVMFSQTLQGQQRVSSKEWDLTTRQYPGEHRSHSDAHLFASPLPHQMQLTQHNIDKMQKELHQEPRHLSLPTMSSASLISPPAEKIKGFEDIFAGQNADFSGLENEEFTGMAEDDEDDQFFSITEASDLDKFLDNLAFSSEVNPLEFYDQNQPRIPHMFEMQTMDPLENTGVAESVKRYIAHAFKQQPTQDLKSFGAQLLGNLQVETPDTSMGGISGKRSREDSLSSSSESYSEGSVKERRKSTKPILSFAQRRLNHSHLEQKRRLLCKEAYERCLRLVTNFEDYKNELVSASKNLKSRKKSKRKQLNKEGFPNLSKHSALLKISSEIVKIQSKNKELKKLLSQSC